MKKCVIDNPILISEWDWDKNDELELDPNYLTLGSGKKAWWKCAKGHHWMCSIASRNQGHNCPFCCRNKLISTDEFFQMILRYNPNIELLSEYIGENKKIKFKCKNCGMIFEKYSYVLTKEWACPNCSAIKRKKIELEKLKQKIYIEDNSIEIIGEYVNCHTKIECRCLRCGNIFKMTPINIKSGQRCPKCGIKKNAKRQTKKKEDFIQELHDINPNIEIIGEYINSHTKLEASCLLCGNHWLVTPQDLLHGNGCPKCSHTSTSFFERVIFNSFSYALGREKVISRDRKLIGKELDIFVPSLSLAVEPGSWHWHKSRLKNDIEKMEKCKEKGVRLIIIYDNFDGNNTILPSSIKTFSDDFGLTKNNSALRKLISSLFFDFKISFEMNDYLWEKIIKTSYEESRMITTKSFVEELSSKNPTIIVHGQYNGALNPIECECSICRHKWVTTPSKLKMGKKCRICSQKEISDKQRKKPEQYALELQNINPNVEIIGTYRGALSKIKVKCKICGNIWEPIASNLLRNRHCPKCHGKKLKF